MREIEEILEDLKADKERQTHMELLADAFFEEIQFDDCEFGGWGLDCKRPFGNSTVEPDLAEIIGWTRESIYDENDDHDEEKCSYLRELYYDLGPYLKWKWSEMRRMTFTMEHSL